MWIRALKLAQKCKVKRIKLIAETLIKSESNLIHSIGSSFPMRDANSVKINELLVCGSLPDFQFKWTKTLVETESLLWKLRSETLMFNY